jgi:hypothetical protein
MNFSSCINPSQLTNKELRENPEDLKTHLAQYHNQSTTKDPRGLWETPGV